MASAGIWKEKKRNIDKMHTFGKRDCGVQMNFKLQRSSVAFQQLKRCPQNICCWQWAEHILFLQKARGQVCLECSQERNNFFAERKGREMNANIQTHILSLTKLWSYSIQAAAVCVAIRYSHHNLRLFLLSKKFVKNICTLTSATLVP